MDRFAVYDDVTFIKQGWINRNRILFQGKPRFITIPLVKQSSNKLICDTRIADSDWQEHLVQTLKQAYRRAPYYNEVMPLITDIILSSSDSIDSLAFESLRRIADFLDIHTEFIRSTRVYDNRHLKGQERVIDICIQEKATDYVNAPGGRSLCSHEDFRAKGLSLHFLETLPYSYRQFGNIFHPHLSIIDVLTFCSSEGTKELLQKYRLSE